MSNEKKKKAKLPTLAQCLCYRHDRQSLSYWKWVCFLFMLLCWIRFQVAGVRNAHTNTNSTPNYVKEIESTHSRLHRMCERIHNQRWALATIQRDVFLCGWRLRVKWGLSLEFQSKTGKRKQKWREKREENSLFFVNFVRLLYHLTRINNY